MNSLNISDIVHYKRIENDVIELDLQKIFELTNVGINKDTLETFSSSIFTSKERGIPILKYHDSEYTFNGYSYFSETFKEHNLISKKPSFFYIEPVVKQAIKTVIICPDPIELLSYYQIRSVSNEETLLIAPHPHTKLSSLSWLIEMYPNRNYFSIYPQNNPEDILNNIVINLALSGFSYTLKVANSIMEIEYKTRSYRSPLSEINMPFFTKVISKRNRVVKSYNPPKEYYSFNQVINDN